MKKLLALLLLSGQALALPVIPGAVGFGSDTVAGRGGTVYKVTNLNASGTGSLTACVQASGARVCIFEVSGVINLTSDLFVQNPNITIAGQTAPAPGIMIRGAALGTNNADVLIQHITVGAGDAVVGPTASTRKAFKSDSCCGKSANKVYIDHCTFLWGTDETASIGWNQYDNHTMINSIIAEGLHYSPIQTHSGAGTLIGAGDVNKAHVSVIQNLWIHNSHRNPLTDSRSFYMSNNVIYNGNREGLMIQGAGVSGGTDNTIIGNVFQSGPSTGVLQDSGSSYMGIHANLQTGAEVYLSDNARLLTANGTIEAQGNQWANVWFGSGQSENEFKVLSAPVTMAGHTPMAVGAVRAYVLENVGSRPAESHSVRDRLISDVTNGTGVTRNCMEAGHCRAAPWDSVVPGGYATASWAGTSRALTVPADPSGDADSDGYTNLEEWLHAYSAEVEQGVALVPKPPTNLIAVENE